MSASKMAFLAAAVLFTGVPALVRSQTVPTDAAPAAQKVKTPTYSGTITSLGPDGASFVITDKNGATQTIRTTAATTYQLDKANATPAAAVRVGLTVKGDLAPDGSAVQVASKSPKISTIDQIRAALAPQDDEWSVLRPKIESVQALQTQISDAAVPIKNLQVPAGSLPQIVAELAARREAHQKLAEQLAAARADLVKILTARQELILVELGIIE